jgi:hypothetical protein
MFDILATTAERSRRGSDMQGEDLRTLFSNLSIQSKSKWPKIHREAPTIICSASEADTSQGITIKATKSISSRVGRLFGSLSGKSTATNDYPTLTTGSTEKSVTTVSKFSPESSNVRCVSESETTGLLPSITHAKKRIRSPSLADKSVQNPLRRKLDLGDMGMRSSGTDGWDCS